MGTKFRNATDETLEVHPLRTYVEPGGETPELDDDQAAGFVLQGDTWHAVGDDARAAQLEAIDAATRPPVVEPDDVEKPAASATAAAWADYAVAVEVANGADPDAARAAAVKRTKKQLIEQYGKES